nr:SafA/ExsA family spore coat assembly protein [uncultured Oscillibacter sp.]
MHLTPMRYKDYTWPHNPEVYTVEYRRRMAAHPVPFGRCVLQDLGGAYRVLRGEGVFAGRDAYDQFRALAAVFRETGPGLLVHPVWRAERAYFVALTVTEEPLPDYVRYSFEFWEDWGGYDGGLTEGDDGRGPSQASLQTGAGADGDGRGAYTVRKGDTLWGIARRYQVDLTALIAANPQIKNPNLIYPGDRVNMP